MRRVQRHSAIIGSTTVTVKLPRSGAIPEHWPSRLSLRLSADFGTVRRVSRGYIGLVSSLGFVGALLAGASIWAVGLRTGYCGRYPPPSGFVTVGLVIVAVALACVATPLILTSTPSRTRTEWALAAVSLLEAVAAVAIVVYLGSKFGHAYDCG
jgi:hypothetical protein